MFWNGDPRRTVVPVTVRPTYRRGYGGEQQEKFHKYGMTESITVRCDHDCSRVIRRPSQFLSKVILLLEPTKQVVTQTH